MKRFALSLESSAKMLTWIPQNSHLRNLQSYQLKVIGTSVCLAICLSVHPSVQPSLSFLKIRSVIFNDIVHDDSWPWYLETDKVRFLKKNIGGLSLGPMGLNQAQIEIFPHFLEFGSLVFLEIVYNDSLQQFLTSSRGKSHENIWGPNLGKTSQNRSQN